MTRTPPRNRNPEAGLTMVVVLVILSALLAGGAVALVLQLGSTKSAGMSKNARAAVYCAEGGLAEAKKLFEANHLIWDSLLDMDEQNNPNWYMCTGDPNCPAGGGFMGDLDDPPDGVNDYIVTVKDDVDETAPPIDPTKDQNKAIFLVSRCVKYENFPAEVLELIVLAGTAGHCYSGQKGGCASGTGNLNKSN